MFHLTFPEIILKDVNWWAMINHEKLVAKEASIIGGTIYDYLDRTLPIKEPIQTDNFPQQMLLKIRLPLSVAKLIVHHLDVAYEEVNPAIKKSATVFFDDINAVITHVSNIPAEIRQSRYTTLSGKGLFMHKVPMKATMRLDLSKPRTGEFSADVEMDTLNNSTINPVAETLALVTIKKGEMQKATAHLSGNNFTIKGTMAFNYSDLNITPLKKDSGADGKLKKKTFTSFFANTFLIKNSNPSRGKTLRQPAFTADRGKHPNFFNFLWVSLLTGMLKTIGIPVKLVLK
jgi:hypothetical protein